MQYIWTIFFLSTLAIPRSEYFKRGYFTMYISYNKKTGESIGHFHWYTKHIGHKDVIRSMLCLYAKQQGDITWALTCLFYRLTRPKLQQTLTVRITPRALCDGNQLTNGKFPAQGNRKYKKHFHDITMIHIWWTKQNSKIRCSIFALYRCTYPSSTRMHSFYNSISQVCDKTLNQNTPPYKNSKCMRLGLVD